MPLRSEIKGNNSEKKWKDSKTDILMSYTSLMTEAVLLSTQEYI